MSKEPNIFGLIEYSRHDLFVDTTDAVREADRFYIMIEADAVLKGQEELIAEKDAEIRRLRRALYKACANWADVVAFEETEGIGHDNSVAERWRKMERKCRAKAEKYK